MAAVRNLQRGAKASPLARVYRPLSLEARVWEQQQLLEAGLDAVDWDPEACCPFCRGDAGASREEIAQSNRRVKLR